jgi:hypothetical protein
VVFFGAAAVYSYNGRVGGFRDRGGGDESKRERERYLVG